MMDMCFVGENLSYAVGDRVLFDRINFSFGKEKTGLVGDNGVGKTTLMRILTGQLQPKGGVLHTHGPIGYLPQDFVVHAQQSVAGVLDIEQKVHALDRIASGVGNPHDYAIIGDDWGIVEHAQAVLSRLRLAHVALSRTMATLSGGETTRVFLARLLLGNPVFLLLDEPTNNLDQESRLALYEVINAFNGGVLVVSHDRQLLSFMNQIMELSSLGLKAYGGNYQAYVVQKQLEQEAREQDLLNAQKFLRKTKKVVQQTKEKYEKRLKKGKMDRLKGGLPKIACLGYRKEHAEKTKSKIEWRTDKQVQAAKDKLTDAKDQLEQCDLLNFELEATWVHNTKKVLEVGHLTFAYPGSQPLLMDVNLTVMGPRRLAVVGPNGSGKTTLLKLITQELQPCAGTVKCGVEHVAYLDQRLSMLDQQQTVLENFARMNPDVPATDGRERLAAFLFAHEAAEKVVATLSGGEKMRAALACILMGQNPPQLLLLDEPTNNMDLKSIASIESALQKYHGALLVVSHDETFLRNIGIDFIFHVELMPHR